MGYDDSALMGCTDPPLTTVRQPIEPMGRMVIDLLVGQIGGDPCPHDELLFEPELVVRGSTGPAAGRRVRLTVRRSHGQILCEPRCARLLASRLMLRLLRSGAVHCDCRAHAKVAAGVSIAVTEGSSVARSGPASSWSATISATRPAQ